MYHELCGPSYAVNGAADHGSVLDRAAAWRGTAMAIATVIETWRSAPCPVGTHMLVRDGGDFVGSVSGGCVESDIMQIASEIIAGAPHVVRRYGVANAQAWEVGLPCGGDIAVLVQAVRDDAFAPALFDAIIAAQAAGETLRVGTELDSGRSRIVARDGDAAFVNRYAPPRRLLIVGAVEIAATLASLARALGIGVTIIDPRARFLTSERFPGVALDDRWPDEALAALSPDARTALVTLSHDPKIDDPALVAALDFPTAYIAALGSRASHSARLERLRAQGFDSAALARIEGPAGVAINAINAPEIALSIAAGIIRRFNEGLR